MALAYIEEYERLAPDGDGKPSQIAWQPAVTTQRVSFTTTTQSAAFNGRTRFIRIHTDSICSYVFGSNPTATTSTPRMAAGQTEYFGVRPTDKVAFVTNT